MTNRQEATKTQIKTKKRGKFSFLSMFERLDVACCQNSFHKKLRRFFDWFFPVKSMLPFFISTDEAEF